MRFATALLFSTLAAAQPETRAFKVLVAPNESVDAVSWKTQDIGARIGNVEYKVQGVQPLGSAGKTVIVLDFGATSSTLHACLLAETLSALDRLKEYPRPLLVAADYAPKLTTVVTFRPNPGEDFVIYGGGDLGTLKRQCESGEPRRGRYPGPNIMGSFKSISSLTTLANGYGFQDGPIRVFWLAQYFEWFDFRPAPHCVPTATYGCSEPVPNSAFRNVEAISDADLTVFPIVFGDHKHGELKSPSREEIGEATYMAHYLGGYATPVAGAIGDTLVRIFESTQRGALVSLEGPVTSSTPKPLVVHVAGSNEPSAWSRPLVVNREGHDPRTVGLHVTPLVLPSTMFSVTFGCRVPDVEPQPSIGVVLPPEVMRSLPGNLEIQLHYENEKGLTDQRLDIERPSNSSEPLCIPLIHARDGTKFSLIVRDASTGWIGATDGTLVTR